MVNAQLKNTRKKEDIDENLALLCNLRFKIDSEVEKNTKGFRNLERDLFFQERYQGKTYFNKSLTA